MKTFNAFQAVCCFVAAPFGLSWLYGQTFPGAGIGFYVGCVLYLVAFILNVGSVRIAMDKVDKF